MQVMQIMQVGNAANGNDWTDAARNHSLFASGDGFDYRLGRLLIKCPLSAERRNDHTAAKEAKG